MLDKSIDGALLALRKQIIRGDLDGLAEVERLLDLRGIHMPRVMPARKPDAARHGAMARIVLEALSKRPMAFAEIAEHVARQRPEIGPEAARQRTGQCLAKLAKRGAVRRDGRVWITARI